MTLLRCLPFALLLGNALAQDVVQVSPATVKVASPERTKYSSGWPLSLSWWRLITSSPGPPRHALMPNVWIPK